MNTLLAAAFGLLVAVQIPNAQVNDSTLFDPNQPVAVRGQWISTGSYTGKHGPQFYVLLDVPVATGRSERWAVEVSRAFSLVRGEEVLVAGLRPKTSVPPSELLPFGAVPMLLPYVSAGHLVRAVSIQRADGSSVENVIIR